MIQRIQSIWLLLAAASAFFTLKVPFYSGNVLAEDQLTKSFLEINAQSNLLLLILTVGVGIVSVIAIFLYKDRKQQFRIVLIAALTAIVTVVLYFLQIKKFIPAEGAYRLTSVFAFLIPVLLILAARGIYKDRQLVKSLDRLR